MPNVRTKIKSLYASLSPAQKQLADYILLQNGDDVPFLSVRELAQAVGVSVASISRFARAVGCDSLKALKTQLGRESLSTVKSMYQAIGPEDTDVDIIEKVFTGNIQSLEETLKSLDRGDLIRAAALAVVLERALGFAS